MSSLFRASGKRKLYTNNKYVPQEQEKRIIELESLLATSYAEISDLKQMLTEQGENQRLAIKKLRRERDELRNKNATLVGKLAEVSRKKSFTPPSLSRPLHRSSTSRLPSIPSASDSLKEQYQPVANGSGQDTVPAIKVTASSESSEQGEGVAHSVSVTDESDTDYSDLEEKLPIEEVSMNKNMSAAVKPLSEADQIEWEIEQELSAVVEAANSFTNSSSSPIVFSFLKKEEGKADRKRTPLTYSTSLREREKPRSNTSSMGARYGINGTAKKFQQSSVEPRPLFQHEKNSLSGKKCGSSQNVASAIHKALGKRTSEHDMGIKAKSVFTPEPKYKVLGNSTTKNGRGSVARSASVKVRSRSETMAGVDLHSSTGGVAKTRAMFEKLSQLPGIGQSQGGGQAPGGQLPGSQSPGGHSPDEGQSPVWMSRKESYVSAILSGEDLVTVKNASEDVLTPSSSNRASMKLKPSPKSMPNLLVKKLEASKITTIQRAQFLDDSSIDEQDEGWDELGDMQSFGRTDMRSRINTLSGMPIKGTSKVEIGRKKIKEHRRDSYKLMQAIELKISSEKETGRIDRITTKVELEHISPLLAAKIKTMSLRRIYNQYGGKIAVTFAVAVIEEAWRSYKLRKHFQERLRQMRENRTVARKRASTLQRVPSIMGIRRHFSSMRISGGKVLDPIARSKDKLTKDMWSRACSRTLLGVMERRRSSIILHSVEEKGEELMSARENKLLQVSEVSVALSKMEPELEQSEVLNFEFSTPVLKDASQEDGTSSGTPDDADGTTGSISTDEFVSSSCRPISIFSDCSFESAKMYPVFSLEDDSLLCHTSSISQHELDSRYVEFSSDGDSYSRHANTMPHLSRASKKSKKDTVEELWLKIGIHHFNGKATKGIKYLVKNGLLDDDPRRVADFLIHQKGLSKEKIGEFLGEVNNEFNMAVLESLVRSVNIGDQPIDEALRQFQQLFRMPGEAQKIDKIMEMFAREYHKRNEKLGIFASEDGAYILSFAIMMLHTSLHNPSVKSRTSKKQWVTMNRGTNDGEDFPEAFLLEIFDRIQTTEFSTGTDHTHIVMEIKKQIVGSTIQRLSTTQRYLVHKCNVVEVMELNVRPGFRNKHRRCIFFFNDIAVICKKKHHDLVFKETFSLTNLLSVRFETSYYKCGVQMHAVDRETPYQFNCDSYLEREEIMEHLDNILTHLNILESERIVVLGTSLSTKTVADQSGTDCLSFDAGDLISSMSLSLTSSPPFQHRGGHFVSGVGDLAMPASVPAAFARQYTSSNRISQDSGFISQQLTPSPPHSPFLVVSGTDTETNTPINSRTISPVPNTLSPVLPPTRSKSTDAIHRLSVSPKTTPPPRSPSLELMEKHRHQSHSNVLSQPLDSSTSKKQKKKIGSDKKKDRHASEKKNKGSIFTFSRTKAKDVSGPGGSNRKEKLKQTMSLSRDGKTMSLSRDGTLSPLSEPNNMERLEHSMPSNLLKLEELMHT